MTTLATLTTEHLGTAATDVDLAIFKRAIAVRVERYLANNEGPAEEAEERAIDEVFGDGDFVPRVEALLGKPYDRLALEV